MINNNNNNNNNNKQQQVENAAYVQNMNKK
jgi:hypothetical protein